MNNQFVKYLVCFLSGSAVAGLISFVIMPGISKDVQFCMPIICTLVALQFWTDDQIKNLRAEIEKLKKK